MKDRITSSGITYHQQEGREASEFPISFERVLKHSDQPYTRINLHATTEWEKLIPDSCWVHNVGMIIVRNTEGTDFQANPTSEEIEDISKRVLEIGTPEYYNITGRTLAWLILPGESFQGSPSSKELLWIRCAHKTASYTLVVFPK